MATLYADLNDDLAFVDDLESGARDRAQMEALGEAKLISNAQKAVVQAYFTEPRDRLAAVAAGMRVRIAETRSPRLKAQLDEMLYKQPKENGTTSPGWPRPRAATS